MIFVALFLFVLSLSACLFICLSLSLGLSLSPLCLIRFFCVSIFSRISRPDQRGEGAGRLGVRLPLLPVGGPGLARQLARPRPRSHQQRPLV